MSRNRGRYANRRVAAAARFAEWRAAGVPTLITAHEAYRLSGGLVGTEGDHGASGAMNLSTVARIVEGSR